MEREDHGDRQSASTTDSACAFFGGRWDDCLWQRRLCRHHPSESRRRTLPSIPTFIATLASGSSVNVPIPALASLPGWIQNLPSSYQPTGAKVYVAIVAGGQPAPALSTYQLYGG